MDTDLTAASALDPERPADRALLALLAAMATSDHEVSSDELAWLARLLPGRTGDDLVAWARELAAGGMPSPAELARVVVEPDERWRALRFVARMAWKDGEIAQDERVLLHDLALAFDLPAGAHERVVREMRPLDEVPAERLSALLQDSRWNAPQFATGHLVSPDLVAVLPPQAVVVARVGLDHVEVMALCTTGLVARFLEGAAFLPWGEIISATRGLALGSALTLHLESGAALTLVDARLSGLVSVLERIRTGELPRRTTGAQVTRL